MGKFEQEASKKILAGEPILIHTRYTVKDFLLWPYKAFVYWNKQHQFCKNIFK